MRDSLFILILFLFNTNFVCAQNETVPDFVWGNASFFNINIGESIIFDSTEVKLIDIENHYNHFKIGKDSIWVKVSKRTLPKTIGELRIYVADNKNVKALTNDNEVHGLLKKDVLVCLSAFKEPLLNTVQFGFPISFNDGFLWNVEEDTYQFSYLGPVNQTQGIAISHPGIDIDLHDARGIEKHWLLALENSTVIWINENDNGKAGQEASVLLESDSYPGIYYLYQHLYPRNLEVRKGQSLRRGMLIGTAWGDENWGHLHLSVIKSDTVPSYGNRLSNQVNFFPQLYELYHGELFGYSKSFAKGTIHFGRPAWVNGNEKNLLTFENFAGKGWCFGRWNTTDKVNSVSKGEKGNARLQKVLFSGSKAAAKNPVDFYEYEIYVQNGAYRIRAEIGDLFLPTWQKITFEGVDAGTFSIGAGETKWTNERAIKVKDRKLTIRIYVDGKNEKIAGISEIVFQRAY